MKTNELKNKTAESFGIFKRRSEGVAGPSREVSKRDVSASGVAGTGQENEEREWARRHMSPDPFLAECKTGIIGWRVRTPHKVQKKQSVTERELA
ncbi:MAG: hypothetical protein PHN79_05705 [Methanoregula sp.]|jgi:hypothetical protein|nr:hypothetical protein [Methanoregula sp.]